MTVRVDDIRGVAGFILPGDRVDVVLLRTETQKGETENSADVLVQYVKVLAIDQLVNERQDQPAVATVAKAVTLQVSPDQAQKILLTGNIGKLSPGAPAARRGSLGRGRANHRQRSGAWFCPARDRSQSGSSARGREGTCVASAGFQIGYGQSHNLSWDGGKKSMTWFTKVQAVG